MIEQHNATMERYGPDDFGDHALHSFIGSSGTYPGHKGFSSHVDVELDTEEQDTRSECSDIGAARSRHHLTIPMRTFRHHDVETSESSRNLLSGLNSNIGIPDTVSSGLHTTMTHGVSGPKGKSTFIQRLPWLVVIAFLGNLACTALSVYILVVSDQMTQDAWSIQPSVYLAVLAPLGNLSLRYCLSQGLINDWWNLASRKTTLEALHNHWDHGTSIVSAAISFSTFDKISAAKILIAATFAVNPLLQRASRPYNMLAVANATVPFQLASFKSSFQYLNFGPSTFYSDALSPPMVKIMRDYTNRTPIINQLGGCPGNCTGTVRAPGFTSNCSRDQENYVIRQPMLVPEKLVFQTSTAYNILSNDSDTPNEANPYRLSLQAFYAWTKLKDDEDDAQLNASRRSCHGVSTSVMCVMAPVAIDYPVVLSDNITSVATRPSQVKAVHTNVDPYNTNDPRSVDGLLGLFKAVNNIVQSNVTMSSSGGELQYSGQGSFSYFYTTHTLDGDQFTCEVSASDPTDDMLAIFNEVMFGTSLAAASDSSNISLATNYTMNATELVIVYDSRYKYLIAATIISLLACCSVLPTFDGYWRLDRPYSLSPIEIAKAFDAPLLRSSGTGTSDLPVDKLVKHVGTTQAQYVVITDTDGEDIKLRERKFAVPEVA
ncbi:hypothetical protein KCU65_g6098, partial [Aureobasidium melanogenum]